MHLVKDTLSTFSTLLVRFIFSMAIGIITARVLLPYGKGIYSIVILVYTICFLLGNLGIGNATVYLCGKKRYSLANLASGTLYLAFVIGFFILIIFMLTFGFLKTNVFADVDSKYLYFIVFSIPFALGTLYYGNILQSGSKFSYFNLAEIIRVTVRFIGIVIALLILQKGVLWAVLSWVIAEVATFLASVVFVKKITNIPLKPNWKAIKDSCSFGIKSYSEILFLYLNYQIDMLLVAYLLRDPVQVGYYSIAVSVSRILWHIPTSIGIALFPRLSAASIEESDRVTSIVCRHTIFLTGMVSLIFLIMGKWLIPFVYGDAYLPSVMPFYLLLLGVIATGIFKQLNRNFTGRGKPLLSGLGAVAGLMINVLLNFLLIPKYGINGAAIASTLSFVTIAVVSTILFQRLSQNKWSEFLLIKFHDLTIYKNIVNKTLTMVRMKVAVKFGS